MATHMICMCFIQSFSKEGDLVLDIGSEGIFILFLLFYTLSHVYLRVHFLHVQQYTIGENSLHLYK